MMINFTYAESQEKQYPVNKIFDLILNNDVSLAVYSNDSSNLTKQKMEKENFYIKYMNSSAFVVIVGGGASANMIIPSKSELSKYQINLFLLLTKYSNNTS